MTTMSSQEPGELSLENTHRPPVSSRGRLVSVILSTVASVFCAAVVLPVVIVNIGLSIGGIVGDRPDSDQTRCKSNLTMLGSALDRFAADNDGRYPRTLHGLVPRYLQTLPVCPAADPEGLSYHGSFGPDGWGNVDDIENYAYLGCYSKEHQTGTLIAYSTVRGLIEHPKR